MSLLLKNSLVSFLREYAIIALLAFSFYLPSTINEILVQNFGFFYVPYFKLFFLLLPAVIILHEKLIKKDVNIPHLMPYLLLMSTFLLLESPAFFRDHYEPDYQLFWRQSRMYVYFVLFVNYGMDKDSFAKITRYAFNCGLLFVIISYLGYLGILDTFTSYNIFDAGLSGRPDSLINLNLPSYIGGFLIFLMVVERLQIDVTTGCSMKEIVYLLSFNFLIIINASRGALIMSSVMTLGYIYVVWSQAGRNNRMLLLSFLPVLLVLAWDKIDFSAILDSELLQRYEHETSLQTGRGIQILASWRNFLEHPLSGVGYSRAATGMHYAIFRSNFYYTQILAAGGVVLFIPFMVYYFRMFGVRFRLLTRPEVLLSLCYNFMALMFDRPNFFMVIGAYVSYYVYKNMETQDSSQLSLTDMRRRPLITSG